MTAANDFHFSDFDARGLKHSDDASTAEPIPALRAWPNPFCKSTPVMPQQYKF